jgi:integrase
VAILIARPHEILKLKIKDIVFKTTGNYQYAEVVIHGKTGGGRPIPLINSIPYVKDYLDHEHPQPGNPDAVFISGNRKSLGRGISIHAIEAIYLRLKKGFFPKLVQSQNVNTEDKQKIRELLKKPWNPYIWRHSALTEKSKILKEHVLRQHSGWSPRSNMHLRYLHYFGNESSESLLEAYGIVNPDERADIYTLKPKQCPNCNEQNKPDSRFCARCRMVLSYDSYQELKEQQIDKNVIDALHAEIDSIKKMVMK